MKKRNLLLALVVGAGLLAGCNKTETFFGFGAVAYYEHVEEKAFDVETTIDYVSVVLDGKGVISKLRLDTTQIQVKAAEGNEDVVLTTDAYGTDGDDIKSKWDLLDDYDMKWLSEKVGIGKEWYEQAEAFENWAIGKDLAAVKGAVLEDHYLENGAEVGVSIHVHTWVLALEQAVLNKVAVNGKVEALGVGSMHTQMEELQSDFYVAGAAFTKDKKVLGARIDTFQVPYAIEDGKVVVNTDVKKVQVVAKDSRIRGKHELKEEYGMKDLSTTIGIGLEWYEQANNLVAYLVGKTVTEGLGASGDELANGADIGVSVQVNGYRATLLEAEFSAFNARY